MSIYQDDYMSIKDMMKNKNFSLPIVINMDFTPRLAIPSEIHVMLDSMEWDEDDLKTNKPSNADTIKWLAEESSSVIIYKDKILYPIGLSEEYCYEISELIKAGVINREINIEVVCEQAKCNNQYNNQTKQEIKETEDNIKEWLNDYLNQ